MIYNCPHCNKELYWSATKYFCRHMYSKYTVYYCVEWINVWCENILVLHLKNQCLLDEERIEKLLLLK